MASKMTPEEAARDLDATLRRFPWYLSVGVGETKDRPVLLVYIKSARNPEVRNIAKTWGGFEIITRPVGEIRAI